MLAWLCLLGWLLFLTVVIYAAGAEQDYLKALNSVGIDTNWKATHTSIVTLWIISIILKVAIWGWW